MFEEVQCYLALMKLFYINLTNGQVNALIHPNCSLFENGYDVNASIEICMSYHSSNLALMTLQHFILRCRDDFIASRTHCVCCTLTNHFVAWNGRHNRIMSVHSYWRNLATVITCLGIDSKRKHHNQNWTTHTEKKNEKKCGHKQRLIVCCYRSYRSA